MVLQGTTMKGNRCNGEVLSIGRSEKAESEVGKGQGEHREGEDSEDEKWEECDPEGEWVGKAEDSEWWDGEESDGEGERKRLGSEDDEGEQNDVEQVESSGSMTGESEVPSVDRDNEIVILVVSDDAGHNAGIIRAVTRRDSELWTEGVAPAGTRILSRDDLRRKIIDTTPLRYAFQRSPTAIARKWISHNSLRRLVVDTFVVGVCVITPSILEAPCTANTLGHESCWVDVLRILFRQQKHGILFIVKSKVDIDEPTKRKIQRFIRNHDFSRRNIIFSGSDVDVMTVLEDSIGLESQHSRLSRDRHGLSLFLERSLTLARAKTKRSRSCCTNSLGRIVGRSSCKEENTRTPSPFVVTPIFLEELTTAKKKFAAWSPERIMLFGRTGSGKSTLAQMLTRGKIDPDSTAFMTSSGFRGKTRDIERGEGRGWYVVDTPGFGEPKNGSTISSKDVEYKVKKFVDLVQGTFAHYLFVARKDRVDKLDENLWTFFKLLFGEDISYHFSVVLSDATQEWVDDNMDTLQTCYKGCKSFICAEFPTIDEETEGALQNDPKLLQELLDENEKVGKQALTSLEQKLAKLDRCERPCDYGKDSRYSKIIEKERANSDMKLERSLRIRMIAQGSEVLFRVDEAVSSLVRHLTIDDRIALVPSVL